jgi:hypothetical protein
VTVLTARVTPAHAGWLARGIGKSLAAGQRLPGALSISMAASTWAWLV